MHPLKDIQDWVDARLKDFETHIIKLVKKVVADCMRSAAEDLSPTQPAPAQPDNPPPDDPPKNK